MRRRRSLTQCGSRRHDAGHTGVATAALRKGGPRNRAGMAIRLGKVAPSLTHNARDGDRARRRRRFWRVLNPFWRGRRAAEEPSKRHIRLKTLSFEQWRRRWLRPQTDEAPRA